MDVPGGGMNIVRASEWRGGHERCEDKHDEDDLQNNGALRVIGIGPSASPDITDFEK